MPSTRKDLRAFEDGPVERVRTELEAEIVGILRQADTVFGDVLNALGPTQVEESYDSAEWDFTATASRKPEPVSHSVPVDGILFMAQLELRGRLECHRKQAGADLTSVLLECDTSLRRLRKALAAVDRVLNPNDANRDILDGPELSVSLAVRRLLTEFRRRVMADGEPDDAQLKARFRGAGTQIAILVGHASYPDVRIRDRVLIHQLQKRILAWLRIDSGPQAESGRRLWQDLTACLQMLSQISRRQELVAHDLALIEVLLDSPNEPHDWRGKCAPIIGLNPELDVLLRSPGAQWQTVKPVVEGVRAVLSAGRKSGERIG